MAVEAGARAGVAGRADLLDPDEQGVAVTVQRNCSDVLRVAGGVALAPVLTAASGPECHPPRRQRAAKSFVVHPADHEDLTAVVLLHNGTHEAVGVTLQTLGNLGGKDGLRESQVHPGHSAVRSPGRKPEIDPVLDIRMLPIDLDVVRLTLHVLGATIWVGGQIVLLALMGPLRTVAPAAIAPAARTFAWVAWPAFAVLVLTGAWMLGGGEARSDAYRTTLMIKMTFVLLSGVGAALHTFVKSPSLKGIWATVGLVSGLCAVLLGVSIVEAP